MAKKIKVAGYTQKINYSDGISYRPFSTLNRDVIKDATFVSGDFNVTVNTDSYISKLFRSKDYSDYMSLSTIGFESDTLYKAYIEQKAKLKLNPHILKNYAYFGSLKERMRVAIENIIIHFPAGLIINPYSYENGVFVENGTLHEVINLGNDVYSIVIPYVNIENPFGIKLNEFDGDSVLFNGENKWRNFVTSSNKYVIDFGGQTAPIVGFTLPSSNIDTFLRIDIDLSKTDILLSEIRETKFVIRPNDYEVESFFMEMDMLEAELLNRNSYPKYTYQFNVRQFTDMGIFIENTVKGTWKTTDGWNIDFQNADYVQYVTNLIELCEEIDENNSNLIIRQMVSASMLEFDTISTDIYENIYDTSQKIKTLLSIYGRSFDDVKNHIDGISFANNITYDELDNAPDKYIRDIAKTMGWELFETKSAINLIESVFDRNINNGDRSITNEELEVEVWRRLILNTPYLMKSKGTRKAIEFINRFLGIPKGLVEFNEYIYRAKQQINVQEIDIIQYERDGFSDLSALPVDNQGFPKVLPNSDDIYYQKAGGWYAVTGGQDSELDINTGNNPHMGKNDSGLAYLKQFKNIIPDFEPISYISSDIVEEVNNLYESFNSGTFEGMNGTTIMDTPNVLVKVESKTPIVPILDECGCIIQTDSSAMTITPVEYTEVFECGYDRMVLDNQGYQNVHFAEFYNGSTQIQPTQECCSDIGGYFRYNYTLGRYTCEFGSFIDCERYVFSHYATLGERQVAWFTDLETNNLEMYVPSPECCPIGSEGGLVSTPQGMKNVCYEEISAPNVIDVTDYCIRIDTVYAIDTKESNCFISFEKADSHEIHQEALNAPNQLYIVDEILRAYSDIDYYYEGDKMTINNYEFINYTGNMLDPNDLTHTISFQHINTSNGGNSIVITFTYVPCPTFVESTNCYKIFHISPIVSAVESQNFTIYYQSEINDSIRYVEENAGQMYDFNVGELGLNYVNKETVISVFLDNEVYEVDLSTLNTPLNGVEQLQLNFNSGAIYTLYLQYISCPTCEHNGYSYGTLNTFVNGAPIYPIVSFSDINTNQHSHIQNDPECCPIGTTLTSVSGVNLCMDTFDATPLNLNNCVEWDAIKFAYSSGNPSLLRFPFYYVEYYQETGFLCDITSGAPYQPILMHSDMHIVIGGVQEIQTVNGVPYMGVYDSQTQRYTVSYGNLTNYSIIYPEIITVNNLNGGGTGKIMLQPKSITSFNCSPQSMQAAQPCVSLGNLQFDSALVENLPLNAVRIDRIHNSEIISRKFVQIDRNFTIPEVTKNVSVSIYPVVKSTLGLVDAKSRSLVLDHRSISNELLNTNTTQFVLEEYYQPINTPTTRIPITIDEPLRVRFCDEEDESELLPMVTLPREPNNPYEDITTDPQGDCVYIPTLKTSDLSRMVLGTDYLDLNVYNAETKNKVATQRFIVNKDFQVELPPLKETQYFELYPIVKSNFGTIDTKTSNLLMKYGDMINTVGTYDLSFSLDSISSQYRGNTIEMTAIDAVSLTICDEAKPNISNDCIRLNDMTITSLKGARYMTLGVNGIKERIEVSKGYLFRAQNIDIMVDEVTLYPTLGVVSDSIGDFDPKTHTLTINKSNIPLINGLETFEVRIADEIDFSEVGTLRIPINNCNN